MHRTKREAVPKTTRAGIAAWRICRYLTWTQSVLDTVRPGHANKAVEAGVHTSFVHSSIILYCMYCVRSEAHTSQDSTRRYRVYVNASTQLFIIINCIIYTIICLKYVVVRKLQVAILARSPREMSQTDRIV